MLNISNTIGVSVFSQNIYKKNIYIYISPQEFPERAIEKQQINKQTIFSQKTQIQCAGL